MCCSRGTGRARLEIADSSRGRVLAEQNGAKPPARVGAASFRTLARQTGSVFLSYWLTPLRSHVWVVTGDGIKSFDCRRRRRSRRSPTHQAAIANVLADPLSGVSAGSRLYRLLVAPAVAGLPAGSRTIVPDGALHGGLRTLPVDGPKRHYWIEDGDPDCAVSCEPDYEAAAVGGTVAAAHRQPGAARS
jgi:hypothetical protein